MAMAAFAQPPDDHARRFDPLRLSPIAGLLSLAALAWLLTRETMAGMSMGPDSDLGSLSFFLGAWVVMVVAMMFPAIAPMVGAYADLQRSRDARRALGEESAEIVAFVAGYVVVWTGFGLVAYAVVELLRGLDVHAFSWNAGGRYLAAGVVLVAAVYQLTPSKDACLGRCRSPRAFLGERRRDGAGGALRLGVEHGAWCVGCCWAMMAALFALGVMNVALMALTDLVR